MNRLSRYLFSNSNIAGSIAGLLVVFLYLLDVIDNGWMLLAAGGYIAAALPFAFRDKPTHMPEGLSTAESLEWLRTYAMPRLKQMEQDGLVEASSRALLKQTVTRLLPDAVENYLKLPPAYANLKAIDGGKTAQVLLLEQLDLLQKHVHSLEENIVSADVNSMLANGRFLQEKFNSGLRIAD